MIAVVSPLEECFAFLGESRPEVQRSAGAGGCGTTRSGPCRGGGWVEARRGRVTLAACLLPAFGLASLSPLLAPTVAPCSPSRCPAVAEKVQGEGGRVLVHCMSGLSRSPVVVVYYLMRRNSWRLRCAPTMQGGMQDCVCCAGNTRRCAAAAGSSRARPSFCLPAAAAPRVLLLHRPHPPHSALCSTHLQRGVSLGEGPATRDGYHSGRRRAAAGSRGAGAGTKRKRLPGARGPAARGRRRRQHGAGTLWVARLWGPGRGVWRRRRRHGARRARTAPGGGAAAAVCCGASARGVRVRSGAAAAAAAAAAASAAAAAAAGGDGRLMCTAAGAACHTRPHSLHSYSPSTPVHFYAHKPC